MTARPAPPTTPEGPPDDIREPAPIRSATPNVQPVAIAHHRRGVRRPADEARAVVGEAALAIEVAGGARYTIMRTPGHDRELAVGFLFAEGIVASADEIVSITGCPARTDVVRVRLVGSEEADRAAAPTRNLVVSPSCGLCGREGVEALLASLPHVAGTFRISAERLYALPAAVRERQALFGETGGCHAAASFGPGGDVRVVREDLGRHSALDKLVGAALLAGEPLADCGVFLSGRSSLEMIVKAARAGIPLVAAVSAPSSASVEAADRLGITLCGFVRGDEVAVYTHAERIDGRRAHRRPEGDPMTKRIEKSDEQWRAELAPEQFEVTRQKGTERAFTGKYWDTKDPGTYKCVCCGEPLFRSETKYDSGSGWPSFTQPIEADRMKEEADRSLGRQRTEVMCSACDAHLGHVFDDGPAPTGKRYCINSASLDLDEDS